MVVPCQDLVWNHRQCAVDTIKDFFQHDKVGGGSLLLLEYLTGCNRRRSPRICNHVRTNRKDPSVLKYSEG